MKILIANPNISEIVTDVIMRSARRCALPGTEFIHLTSPGGTRNIDCAYSDYMSAPHMIKAVREKAEAEHPDSGVPTCNQSGFVVKLSHARLLLYMIFSNKPLSPSKLCKGS